MKHRTSDEMLTLWVRKNSLPPRVFQLSLHWLWRFQTLLHLTWLLGISGLCVGGFFYWKSLQPKDQEAARKIEELTSEIELLKSNEQSGLSDRKNPNDASRTHETATDRGNSNVASTAFSQVNPSFFPQNAGTTSSLPSPENLNFKVDTLRASIRGGELVVDSRFEYLKSDGGSQKGHFLILVEMTNGFKVYPESAFQLHGPALLQPRQGEYFSFGRYRELLANFGPFSDLKNILKISLYVFDISDRLIYQQSQKPNLAEKSNK